jgi:hypothetical protein
MPDRTHYEQALLAQQATLEKEIAARKLKKKQIADKLAQMTRAMLHARHQSVGRMADEAGLLALDDADLYTVFAALTPLLTVPNPGAVLAGLLAEGETAEVGEKAVGDQG